MGGGVTRPAIAGVNHVGISVTDLDRSIQFYCDELGTTVVRKPFGGFRGFSGRVAIVALGAHILDLYEHSANTGEGFDPARTGLDHIGFTATSLDELHGWRRWFESRDVECSPIREILNNMGAMFDFVDPNGIQLEFTYIDIGQLPPQAPSWVFRT